ncbi:MAG: hypothetical protein ABSB88_15905 [Bryobacteraceae bacterium]
MKKSLSGLIGTCLLVCAWSLPGWAQEPKPDPQTDAQQQPAPPAQQQTPPPPAQQQAPPAQPPATPPAAPAQQQPPPEAGTQPQQHGRIPEPPPPPPKVPDVRRPGESGFFIGVSAWMPTEQPIFDRGDASTFSGNSRLTMQGKPKYAENVEVGIAAGLHNSLRISFNSMSAAGDFTAPAALVAWGQIYAAGTYVSTNYKIINAKLSYEYLTWPYPVGSKKFRLKTLWQVQYTSISSTFDAPKNYYDSNGNLLIDPSTGNPISLVGSGTRAIISPTLGLGAHYYSSRHVRFEVNGSGFAVPHHWTIWDTDATVNLRLLGHVELRLGAKAFHFKTSPVAAFFLRGTMASAFVGVRWYSNSE